MGLLTKEVEVKMCSNIIDYYENLGYEIPRYYNQNSCTYRVKRGTKILVRIDDLPLNSMKKVMVECDECGKQYPTTYQTYNRSKRDDKYYCRTCALKLFNSGENNWIYNKNKTDEERLQERSYPEYNVFTKTVLARDYYTCICCGHKSTDLEVHHLNGYDWYKEGRVDETNAVTLCKTCHSNFHAYYGKGNNTKEQFEEWFGETLELLKSGIIISPNREVYCIDDDIVYKNTKEASRSVGCDRRRMSGCCGQYEHKSSNGWMRRIKTIKGKHYIWYDVYLSMSDEDVKNYLDYCDNKQRDYSDMSGANHHQAKKVICLNTKEVFNTLTEANEKYGGTTRSNISKVCLGKRKSAGTHPVTKEKLHWMYYEEYVEKFGEVVKTA